MEIQVDEEGGQDSRNECNMPPENMPWQEEADHERIDRDDADIDADIAREKDGREHGSWPDSSRDDEVDRAENESSRKLIDHIVIDIEDRSRYHLENEAEEVEDLCQE